jgi:hypothetical protein
MIKTPIHLFYFSLVFGIFPLLVTLISGAIASLFGCQLNEATCICVILGLNIGPLLGSMGVVGWFSFYTIPLALGGILFHLFGLLPIIFPKKMIENR